MTTVERNYEQALAALRGIWEDVLETTVDDPDQDFFDAGGDSLLALTIAHRAGEAGLDMPRSGVLRKPTLRELAEAVCSPNGFAR